MIMLPTPTRFNHIVAFEVSKAELVVHSLPADRQQRLSNTPAAIGRLLKAEQHTNHKLGLGPLLVVCEATGGYERHVIEVAQRPHAPPRKTGLCGSSVVVMT